MRVYDENPAREMTMATTLEAPLMTTEEMLALPTNGVERWLIRGKVREKPMTVRNRFYSRIMVRLAKFLDNWVDKQPDPHGQVLCGEAGCRLARNPDTTVGVDVVYVAANLNVEESDETTLIDGIPVLAVEILSPNDTVEEIGEKVELYQKHHVPLVWVIDPYDRTVTIYRLNREPELVNIDQELSAEPHLPGFRVAVKEIFA
jgi:Uma2 family endonuclease